MAKHKENKNLQFTAAVYDVVFEEVMHNSMLPYSENVILDRALPRVEDGLKPVQRRILYAMHEMGLTPDKPYKKSARIVGDCLGKYHPHGDSSVYGAMVRMAQPFSMRMKLVDGHGNFGSADGDPPAAMRYTEARMSPLALELLRDLDKDTVTWSPNFDDSMEEPNMLPGRFPNLLVNGASGIAVGLATNIPPHNIGEAIDAVVAVIDNPKITTKELLGIIHGPDFPTGGFIIPVDSMESIYETGKGKLKIRARLHIEDDGGKKNIVVTEMPYQVSKAEVLKSIAKLRDENKELLGGINEIVDESDKTGMRAVIKLKREADAAKIVSFLLKKTNLELGYSVNMVAIAGGKPEQMGLKAILTYYVAYQRDVIVRRTAFDLKAAKQRAEIVRGLLIAIRNIDEVIKIIKSSESTPKAKLALRERFDLTDDQAQAIVDMRLKALTHLEVGKLEEELAELEKRIAYLSAILASPRRQYGVIKDEILQIKKNMNSARVSVILDGSEGESVELPTAEEAVTYRDGVLVRSNAGTLRFMSQKNWSALVKEAKTLGGELPAEAVAVNNKGWIYVFTDRGNIARLDISDVAERKWKDKGMNLSQFNRELHVDEKPVKIMFFPSTPVGELVFFTRGGIVKRSDWNDFTSMRAPGSAIILAEGDSVINVETVDDDLNVLEVTKGGLCLVYRVTEIPVQGRKAAGVRGVKLGEGDSIAFGGQIDDEGEIIVMTDTGYAKRVIASTIDPGSRYLKGVKIVELDKGSVVFVGSVKMPYDLAVSSGGETYVLNTEGIRIDTRTTKGKMTFKAGISGAVKLPE
ncbi:MAG TPA: DNA topoisomerase 4 subunit A [Candidatus Limadaptatus stercorigallinarum]|uniref:DNA topoisomerase (ATP-hydrolyzing) n=1 Tax=Candidatus Limadaptatus stercorigallinarum TaxID=2840845 RepID=A0A9D1L1J7_9FIRM|nr:DNA topoisomerase 4 subunit A [Candidatus Limadaptatus stercorigallinarum]